MEIHTHFGELVDQTLLHTNPTYRHRRCQAPWVPLPVFYKPPRPEQSAIGVLKNASRPTLPFRPKKPRFLQYFDHSHKRVRMPLSLDSKIKLNSGYELPQLGFGVRAPSIAPGIADVS